MKKIIGEWDGEEIYQDETSADRLAKALNEKHNGPKEDFSREEEFDNTGN